MAFATVDVVKEQSTFREIKELDVAAIERYITYANAFLRRFTGVNYREAVDPDLLADLERVTVLLVEYLWLSNQPETKESDFSGITSENIGSYSYSASKGSNELTGNLELDQLLMSLRPTLGINFFSVSGPSKYEPFDVKHAYVTRINKYEN